MAALNAAPFEFATAKSRRRAENSKGKVGESSPQLRGAAGDEKGPTAPQPKNTRFASKDRQVQMSPKVLETWINETL